MTAIDRWHATWRTPPSTSTSGQHRRGGERAVRSVALTSCTDQVEHQVSPDALDRAATAPGTAVLARCGASILPAPLCSPPGRPCRACLDAAERPRHDHR